VAAILLIARFARFAGKYVQCPVTMSWLIGLQQINIGIGRNAAIGFRSGQASFPGR
jgi:hypothetical protein